MNSNDIKYGFMRREFWLRQCRTSGPQYSAVPYKPEGKHFKVDEYFKTVEIKDDEVVISLELFNKVIAPYLTKYGK